MKVRHGGWSGTGSISTKAATMSIILIVKHGTTAHKGDTGTTKRRGRGRSIVVIVVVMMNVVFGRLTMLEVRGLGITYSAGLIG